MELSHFLFVQFLFLTHKWNVCSQMVDDIQDERQQSSISCYWGTTLFTKFQDIQSNPPYGRSIFFLDTSCRSYLVERLFLTPREACAIESAARNNPNMQIYVVFAVPAKIMYDDKVILELLSYTNVNFRKVNIDRLARGSPLELLLSRNGQVSMSLNGVYHVSDMVRLLLLWRYGGIYLDSDMITLKSFEDLPLNFAGLENESLVGNAILGLDITDDGRRIAELCMSDMRFHYARYKWNNVGTGSLSRVVRKICASFVKCDNDMQIFPIRSFFPIRSEYQENLFKPYKLSRFVKDINNSYTLHFWNRESKNNIPVKGSPFLYLAKYYCPRVYSVTKDW